MKHTDRIQKYLDGNLSEEELKKFKEDLQKDPELLEELDLHRSLNEVVTSQDENRFRKKLNEAYKVYKVDVSADTREKHSFRKSSPVKYLSYFGAVVFFIAGIFTLHTLRKQSNEVIFNKYFTPFVKELSSRNYSENDGINSALMQGVNLYLQNDFSEASKVFNIVLSENPDNTDAQFYNGLCYIYLNDFRNAISSFDNVLRQPYNYYQEYARWYLAMCYIGTNSNPTARSILIEISSDSGYFSVKAKKVLRKLR